MSNKTPQEAWSGFKPSVNHLRIFGCIGYAHIPKQKREKLDQKSEKVIFVGYSYNTKASKLYNPWTRKVIVSRDVIFDEDKTWKGLLGNDGEPYVYHTRRKSRRGQGY